MNRERQRATKRHKRKECLTLVAKHALGECETGNRPRSGSTIGIGVCSPISIWSRTSRVVTVVCRCARRTMVRRGVRVGQGAASESPEKLHLRGGGRRRCETSLLKSWRHHHAPHEVELQRSRQYAGDRIAGRVKAKHRRRAGGRATVRSERGVDVGSDAGRGGVTELPSA